MRGGLNARLIYIMPFNWDDPTEFFDDDWQEIATINGTDYNCIRFVDEHEKETVDAGEKNKKSFKLMFIVSDFSSMAEVGTKIDFSGTTYRIHNIKLDSTAKCYIVELSGEYGEI